MVIKIKDSQLQALESHALEGFVHELVAHCYQHFPHIQRTVEENVLRKVLADCIEKAEQIGFTQRGPVKFYLDMLIVYGVGFETDPQYPWVRDILEKTAHLPQMDRALALHQKSDEYLDLVSGPQNRFMFEVAERLEQIELENANIYKTGFSSYMHTLLKEFYPQKYEHTGEAAISMLIEQGEQKAQEVYGFDQARPAGLIVVLMYLLGHQVDKDPFYVWASPEKTSRYDGYTLIVDDQGGAAKRLERRARVWMEASVRRAKELQEKKAGNA